MKTKYRQNTEELLRRKDQEGMTFRERLREIKGALSREEFAARCGASVSTAQEWLNAGVRGRARSVLPGAVYLNAIAEGFEVTTDWLLGIKGARKYPVQQREDTNLAIDVREHVVREGAKAAGTVPEQWLRELLGTMIPEGQTLLEILVDIVAEDVKANAAWFRERAAAANEIARIESSVETGLTVDAHNLLAILRRLYAAPPPTGTALAWQPVTLHRPRARKKKRRT